MKLAPLVAHLEALADFDGRVNVAADLQTAVAIARPMASPSCVVFGPRESAGPNNLSTGGPRHDVTVTLGVMSVVRYAGDTKGGAAYEILDDLRASLHASLLGWVPEADHWPLEYASGRLAFADAGMLIWLDEYRTHYLLVN